MTPRVACLDCSTDVLVHKSKIGIGGKLIHKKSGTNFHSRRLGVYVKLWTVLWKAKQIRIDRDAGSRPAGVRQHTSHADI